jgi:RHS repeat-associated protein
MSRQTVVSQIELPNQQSYTFTYDPAYGLLRRVTYPDGGYVRYVWGANTNSDSAVWGQGSCGAKYDTPVVLHRYVSYDGSSEVLQQDFSYSTAWNPDPGDRNARTWSSKTTIVTTHDLVSDGTSTTTYTYLPYYAPEQPLESQTKGYVATQIPLESTINYNGLETVTEKWGNAYRLYCRVSTVGGLNAGAFYQYGPGAQMTDKKEYDYGILTPSMCQNNTPPSATPTRETVISYGGFGNTPIFTYGPSILNRPSTITTYGNGAPAAQTTYAYSMTVSAASVTVGRDAQYNGNSSVPRGNATSISRWVNTSGASLTWNYTYDDTGQMLSKTDPKNNNTQYFYTDEFSACGSPSGSTNAYLTKITDPKGFTQSFTYRYCDGQLASATDQNNQTTSYSYADSLDRLTSISYADGGLTTYTYGNACGHPATTTIALGGGSNSTESTTLDGVCRVTRNAITSDPQGTDYTDITYDGLGRVWKVSNPYRSTSDPTYGLTTYAYDALGRTTSVTYPDGNVATTSYSGNSSTVTDAAGKTRTLVSDALGRVNSVTENPGGLNYSTSYTYNALDNLTTVTQGSQTRTFVYDSLSRLTSASNPESGLTSYTYPTASGSGICSGDPSSPCTRTDARGITTTYTYNDPLSRLTGKSYNDNPQTPSVSFSYDESTVHLGSWTSPTLANPIGRLTHTTTMSGSTLLTATVQDYDQMGRTKHYWQCTPLNCGNASIWSALYNYDLAGDVTSWNHPAGFTITQNINGARRIAQVTSSLSDATHPGTLATGPGNSIQYAPWGEVSSLLNGCAGSGCTQLLETYHYNKRMQADMVELGTSGNATADSCRAYNYYTDVANPTSCTAPSSGTHNNGNVMGYLYQDSVNALGHTATYTYDGVDRLKTAVATGSVAYTTQTYSYTADGSNGQYGNMSCTPAGVGCATLTFAASTNHITTSGYAYDLAGNLTGDGTYTYQWDAEERLTKVLNGLMQAASTNTYNALGQRVRDVTLSATTDEAYSAGGELLWRYTGGDANTRVFVPFGGRILADYYSNQMIFYHSDELGSVTTSTLYTGGPCQERLFYPYGELWTGAGSCGTHQTFAQLPDYDPETDQYNTLNRHYSPSGRWLSPDPFIPFNLEKDKFQAWISDPQHWNKYAYVRNNPTTLTDPSGLTETIYYWEIGNLSDVQRKYFEEHKREILSAIAAKLQQVGIKDVVFKEGSSLTKSQIASMLANPPAGVAFLNFANTSFAGFNAPSDTFGGHTGGIQIAVFMGNLQSESASTFVFRLAEVGSHELGHRMGFYSRGEAKSALMFWNNDLMNEGQSKPMSLNPYSWFSKHFDMSIPQNQKAVEEINKLPEYQPQ